jgi:hypothetical protein
MSCGKPAYAFPILSNGRPSFDDPAAAAYQIELAIEDLRRIMRGGTELTLRNGSTTREGERG